MIKNLKVILFLTLFFVAGVVSAEEGHGEGIPKIVYYQALNFFGLLLIMFFIVKGKVSGFFNKRREELTKAIGESRRLKEEAEKKHEEYSIKIQTLEKETEASMEKIRQDGEAAK